MRGNKQKYERLPMNDISCEPNTTTTTASETNICKICYKSLIINITSIRCAQWFLNIIFYCFLFTIFAYHSFKSSINIRHNNVSKMQINFTFNSSTLKRFQISNESDVPIKYFLNTSQCFIPYINPLSPEIRKLYKPHFATDCSKDKSFVKVLYDNNAKQYILRMDMKVAQEYNPYKNLTLRENSLQCCYQEIIRSGTGAKADSQFILLPCTNFLQDYMVPSHVDSLVVVCKLNLTHKTIKRKDAFFLVQVKNRTHDDFNISARRKTSLILWGIDSISRINFRRTMPKTFNYLAQKKWYELRGYNKVGCTYNTNTFKNSEF
uniref:Uncharacterized protein n=1 Tax=Glossina brevipalpis TaxID=37001 RepID=A0A1A9WNL7_9MUSC